ncbi:LPS assembly lipoprotein LptE [Halomonas korlensis]|uniref:LPS-assembly lipoprotein LptE n=1 Tax=Halomonas korlensis TaxID=463301 RepID=A0A1I7FAV4_9GAMM|nr:LPS assembly lipoprotein LptE [Halomonas korlensis]SFU33304.1 LPS-assembly lipoprotein [Halomonas korlensis]
MQRRTFLNLILAGSGTFVLAGCGFRLRGVGSPMLALESLALSGADSELLRLAGERLEAAGTRLDDDADLVLNLGNEMFRERQLGVLDSGTQERELELTVPFSVQRRDGTYLLDQQRLEVTTSFTVSEDNLLSNQDLRDEAMQQLRQQAVQQLLDRLRSLAEE